MLSENQNSLGMSELQKMFRKKRNRILLYYELEDDMKGWDVEYHIQRKNGMVSFLILPYQRSPAVPERCQKNKEPISFAIPEKLIKRVPCFDKDTSWEKQPALQIIKPYRLQKSGAN